MINILITGDYSPQYRVATAIEKGEWEHVFGEVRSLTSQMDYSVTNFETAVTDATDLPIRKCGPHLYCTERSVEALRWAGFNMVTLANNHFYDYGDSSVRKSLKTISSNNLDCVGGGINIENAKSILYKEIKSHRLAFINCCESEFSIATENHGGSNPLNPIQQYYQIKEAKENADYCIVIVHGGHEHFQLPSLRMKEVYRFYVDAGADVVVNHHQHCFSGYEIYHGSPIFYGLGNFCFDHQRKVPSTWNEGYALQLQFDSGHIGVLLHPYIQCRESPTVSFLKNREQFDLRISELNEMIADDKKLTSALDKFYLSSDKTYLSIFEPYNNRYVFAAWYRNLLPSFFRGKKCVRAYDYVACESHLDRLRHIIATYMNNQEK